jgi:ribonucleoside-triphosphate reductase
MSKKIRKRSGSQEQYSYEKILNGIEKAFRACGYKKADYSYEGGVNIKEEYFEKLYDVDDIRNKVEEILMNSKYKNVAKAYILYRNKRKEIKEYVQEKQEFINKYKKSANTANATVDDNSNVGNKNVAVLNSEIHKQDNMQISRGMVTAKLKELFPDFDSKQYTKDLEHHIIYKHDESSFGGAIAPYCVSISMYPFLLNGIKDLGGLSAAPKNLDSYCGMFCNLVFAVSSQFAGAVAVSEALLYFTYFCKKEWGEDFWKNPDRVITAPDVKTKTIRSQIHQYWQQIIYTISQPAAARGYQSAFVNFSYFDHPFFDAMFGEFIFPDGSRPDWDSLFWIQKEFMKWFNAERLRCILTFPVESYALIYKDGEFVDKESAEFVAQEWAEGHSFFLYISDTADSLSSCCRLKNKVQTKEFSFTNGNMGVMTGSKSVITLNLSRIVQDWSKQADATTKDLPEHFYGSLTAYIKGILERVYKYHIAYNELLWDVYDAKLLPVYSAGFISLNKQYLTIGINGLNQAAEFLGFQCTDNEQYSEFCRTIFSAIKESNQEHNGKFKGHTLSFNTECVPAESLAIKNYNWDKEDGYWVPNDTNLYASYIYKPNDTSVNILDKIRMHGNNYIGDNLDGGSAAHLNLSEHLSKEQYLHLMKYAAQNGCSYLTWNVPNSECRDCGFITKVPITKCPHCGSEHIDQYDRIIGYLTKISNWSEGRQIEQKTRVYSKDIE